MGFNQFNLDEKVMDALTSMNFTVPTPVQIQAIPYILNNKDLIACAQTGTGKTAAYLLPILNKLTLSPTTCLNTIILVPTRELALQIDQALEGFSYYTSISSIAIYGGGDGTTFERERKALKEGANIIVATPGRLIAHLSLGYVDLSSLQHLVLDEADNMLDMGFYDDIMRIISYLPKMRQTLLFSATMPSKIRELSKKILIEPEQVNIAISKPAEGVLQAAYSVYNKQKNPLIVELLKGKNLQSVIIFSSTKSNVKILEKELKETGLLVRGIHSDLEQSQREEVLREFRNRQFQVLVATDILSRGIDIEGINLVVNYDVPQDAEDYIHRIGRTARAASTGVAITFINESDQRKFQQIENLIESEVHKVPLPPSLGEGPPYDPQAQPKTVKRPFKKFKKK